MPVLLACRLKAVSIEITEKDGGVFDITATMLGAKLETQELAFQDLLQKQYEGIGRMKLFDVCTVNVNLLIFLINRKFYGN